MIVTTTSLIRDITQPSSLLAYPISRHITSSNSSSTIHRRCNSSSSSSNHRRTDTSIIHSSSSRTTTRPSQRQTQRPSPTCSSRPILSTGKTPTASYRRPWAMGSKRPFQLSRARRVPAAPVTCAPPEWTPSPLAAAARGDPHCRPRDRSIPRGSYRRVRDFLFVFSIFSNINKLMIFFHMKIKQQWWYQRISKVPGQRRQFQQLTVTGQRHREGTPKSKSTVRRLRRHRRVPALRGAHLRGLQGLLQEDRAEGLQVRVPCREELSRGQATTQQMPVLSLPKVLKSWNGQGGKVSDNNERL